MIKIFVAVITLLLCHPVHLTVTNVEYFAKKKYFIIQIRFFRDDLEKAISLDTGVKPDFRHGGRQEQELLLSFIKKYLTINIDGHKLDADYQLEDYHLEDITLWARVKVKYREGRIGNVRIVNRLMLNLYPDQQNLLIFVYNNRQKGLTFNRKHTQQALRF